MKTIIVNHSENSGIATHYMTVIDDHILTNLATMFGDSKKNLIISQTKQGFDFYDIFRFCQFVCYIQYTTEHGLSMKFSDFGNNIDNVLDEYLILTEKDWTKSDKDKHVKIVQDIINDKDGELAKINLIPLGNSI